jgi:hypothetical protein
MNRSLKPPDPDLGQEHEEQDYHIVYLAKRRTYTFAFLVSKMPLPSSGKHRAFFQVRFRDQRPTRDLTLDLDTLMDFHESLSRLMDYVQIERQKRPDRY